MDRVAMQILEDGWEQDGRAMRLGCSYFNHFGRRMGKRNRQTIFSEPFEVKLDGLVDESRHLFT